MSQTTSHLRVSEIMSRDLVEARANEPLNEAVTRMLEKDVGSILVTENGKIEGIITKGDVLKKAFLFGLEAREVSCKRVMSSPARTIEHDASIEAAAKLMGKQNISKLPVVKEGKLVGIVTSTDIIRAEPMK